MFSECFCLILLVYYALTIFEHAAIRTSYRPLILWHKLIFHSMCCVGVGGGRSEIERFQQNIKIVKNYFLDNNEWLNYCHQLKDTGYM